MSCLLQQQGSILLERSIMPYEPGLAKRRDAPLAVATGSKRPLTPSSASKVPEIGSVKDELALLFALGNPWEGAQIGETLDDRSQGETLDVIIERRASRLDSRRRGID